MGEYTERENTKAHEHNRRDGGQGKQQLRRTTGQATEKNCFSARRHEGEEPDNTAKRNKTDTAGTQAPSGGASLTGSASAHTDSYVELFFDDRTGGDSGGGGDHPAAAVFCSSTPCLAAGAGAC